MRYSGRSAEPFWEGQHNTIPHKSLLIEMLKKEVKTSEDHGAMTQKAAFSEMRRTLSRRWGHQNSSKVSRDLKELRDDSWPCDPPNGHVQPNITEVVNYALVTGQSEQPHWVLIVKIGCTTDGCHRVGEVRVQRWWNSVGLRLAQPWSLFAKDLQISTWYLIMWDIHWYLDNHYVCFSSS